MVVTTNLILDVHRLFDRTKMSANFKTGYSLWVSSQILLKYITVWFDDESTGLQQNVNLKTWIITIKGDEWKYNVVVRFSSRSTEICFPKLLLMMSITTVDATLFEQKKMCLCCKTTEMCFYLKRSLHKYKEQSEILHYEQM